LKKKRLSVASGTLQISTKVIKFIIAIWGLLELGVKKGGEYMLQSMVHT